MNRYLIPLGCFIILVAFLAVGLSRDPHEIPSPLINKPAPAFQLTQLQEPNKNFGAEEMRGKVWILNAWASWCVSCGEEHPLLLEYSRTSPVPIYGLDYKDQRNDAISWLGENGNPYVLSAFDSDGRVGIDFGVYGVPETYVIDKSGVIRFKQIGPITREVWQQTILPLVKDLSK